MAITNYAALKAKIAVPSQLFWIEKVVTTVTSATGKLASTWLIAPLAGVAPSTAVVPTKSTAGAIGQRDAATILRILQIEGSTSTETYIMLVDRLSHQGGLSGTVTGAQTTNLPTAALTRYTSGAGVWPCLEIYTAIGTTGATVTASYTDQDGNSGQTTIATAFGVTGSSGAGRLVPLPLAAGDSGARAVASVTLSGTTGTAGNFGVTLIKPLLILPFCYRSSHSILNSVLSLGGIAAEIEDDACLQWLIMCNVSATPFFHAVLRFAEDD